MRFHFLNKQQLIPEMYRTISKWMSNYSQIFISSFYSISLLPLFLRGTWELQRCLSTAAWQSRQRSAPCCVLRSHRTADRRERPGSVPLLSGEEAAARAIAGCAQRQRVVGVRCPLLCPAATRGSWGIGSVLPRWSRRLPEPRAGQTQLRRSDALGLLEPPKWLKGIWLASKLLSKAL